MATGLADNPDVDTPPGQGDESKPAPRSGFRLTGGKLKLTALLLVVMGVQVTVGYMLLPAPAASSREVDAPGGDGDPVVDKVNDTVEVDLGDFNPTNLRGSGGVVMHVSFSLTGIVSRGNAEAFKTAVRDTHGARIRAAVIRVIRSSNLEDLKDPDFNVIRRKIREAINKVLQQSYVVEVVLDSIRLMPQ